MNFFKKIFHKKPEKDNLSSYENIFSRENIVKASEIMSNYGKILEIYNDACEPISILPNSKDEIKNALKAEYLFLRYYNNKGETYTEDDSKFNWGLSVSFVALSNFVEDDLSISYKKFPKTANELTDSDNTYNKSIDLMTANLKIFELQKIESEKLLQEWREWEIQVPNILNKLSK